MRATDVPVTKSQQKFPRPRMPRMGRGNSSPVGKNEAVPLKSECGRRKIDPSECRNFVEGLRPGEATAFAKRDKFRKERP